MFARYFDLFRSTIRRPRPGPRIGTMGSDDSTWYPTHRHRKGGEYRVLGTGILEADRSDAVIYDDRDGTTWIRAKAEFDDGRFEPIVTDRFVQQKKKSSTPRRLNFSVEEDLLQLQRLSTPLWIFDVDRHGIWWANPQGLAFWKADSIADIQKRDFSTDSATVRDRLRQIVELAAENTRVTDTWTLYPSDSPQTTVLTFQPVEIEGRFKAILIEVVQVLERNSDDDTWRLLEAARATSLMITSFSMTGKLLIQNPAALACYGSPKQSAPDANDLAERFVDSSIADRVLSMAAANETSQWEADVLTASGPRTHSVSVRKGRDPITGDFLTVLSEEDVTGYVRLREKQEDEKILLADEVAKRSDMLRISQERYALAVQTAAILDWDARENRVFLSPSLTKKLGYSEAEFADQTPAEIFHRLLHPDDFETGQAKFTQHLERPGDVLSMEMQMVARNGDAFWYNLQGTSVRDGFGKVTRFSGLLTDITERKQLERKLMGSQRMEAIGQLTGGIAHDFNNLLTVIQGNAELLEASTTSDTELTREIVSAAKRGADLTRHLLAFARQQTLIPKTIDLNELVPKTIKSLLRTISETVTVDFQSSDDLWRIHADRTLLETAILNLALNARDAMEAGGKVKISCANVHRHDIPEHEDLELSQEKYVAISISDNGNGMSDDALRKAFEPFFTTKGIGQGSGLGLSMVLGFSRQSGGDTRINSEPGYGTTVTMYLPEAQGGDLPAEVEPKAAIMLGAQENIHILEDNQHVQQVVSKLVESLGYNVTRSNDAQEAQEHIDSGAHTDLFLLDILLPGGFNGVEVAQYLRKRRPNAKILFMSGFSDNHLIENSGLESDTSFISKPFDRSTIAAAIVAALARADDEIEV